MITGFDTSASRSPTASSLNTAVAGAGSPIVLLHGFPQTHLMWRARRRRPRRRPHRHLPRPARLRRQRQARRDDGLRQAHHGRRHRRAGPGARPRAVRARRARPRRAGRLPRRARPPRRDHPPRLPRRAADAGHVGRDARRDRRRRLPPLPDGAAARPARADDRRQRRRLLRPLPRPLDQRPAAIPPDVRAAYLDASRDAVPSIVADYRASAGIDVDHDQADRDAGHRCACRSPCSSRTGAPRSATTPPRCGRPGRPTSHHRTVTCGHFMAEEAPAEVAAALRQATYSGQGSGKISRYGRASSITRATPARAVRRS